MEVLDPRESLVRTLYFSAALRSFCTWFSVQAATIGLWVGRFFSQTNLFASESYPRLKPSSTFVHKRADSSISAKRPASCLSTAAEDKARIGWHQSEEVYSVRKSRLTAYYNCEDVAGVARDGEEDEEEITALMTTDGSVEMHSRSTTLPVSRTADLGWYGSQDMRVFDGSVVRLWKGDGPNLKAWPMATR